MTAPAEPIRYRVHTPAHPPHHERPPFTLYPDGRAFAALTAIARQVTPLNLIVRQIRTGKYATKVERTRTHRVLHAMRRHGLVQLAPGLGWTATPEGRAAAERAALTGRPVAFTCPETEIQE